MQDISFLAHLSPTKEPQGHVPPYFAALTPVKAADLQAMCSKPQVLLEFPAAYVVLYFVAIQGKKRPVFEISLLSGNECYKGVCCGCVSRVKVRPCRPSAVPPAHGSRAAPCKGKLPCPPHLPLQMDVLGFLFVDLLRLGSLPFLRLCHWPT